MDPFAPPKFWTEEGLRLKVRGPAIPGEGKVIERTQPFARIGRAAGSDVLLDHPSVSRRHAFLQRMPEGIFLVDLGSREGTQLGNDAFHQGWIRPGSVIRIGPFSIEVEAPEPVLAFDPLAKSDFRSDPLLPVVLSITDRRGFSARHRLKRPLTLLGRTLPSNLRLADAGIANVHYVLYRTRTALWLVNLILDEGPVEGIGVIQAHHGFEFPVGNLFVTTVYRRRGGEPGHAADDPSASPGDEDHVMLSSDSGVHLTSAVDPEVAQLRRDLDVLRTQLARRGRSGEMAEELARSRAHARDLERLLDELDAPTAREEVHDVAAASRRSERGDIDRLLARVSSLQEDRDRLVDRLDDLEGMLRAARQSRPEPVIADPEAFRMLHDAVASLRDGTGQFAALLAEKSLPESLHDPFNGLLEGHRQAVAAMEEATRRLEAVRASGANSAELAAMARRIEELEQNVHAWAETSRRDRAVFEARLAALSGGAGFGLAPANGNAAPPEEDGDERPKARWLFSAPPTRTAPGGIALPEEPEEPSYATPSPGERSTLRAERSAPGSSSPAPVTQPQDVTTQHLLIAEALLNRAAKAHRPWSTAQMIRTAGLVALCVAAFTFFGAWFLPILRGMLGM